MLFQRADCSGEHGKCEKNQAGFVSLMFISQNTLFNYDLWFFITLYPVDDKKLCLNCLHFVFDVLLLVKNALSVYGVLGMSV